MTARELKALLDRLAEEHLDLDVEFVGITPDSPSVEAIHIAHSVTTGPAPIYCPPGTLPPKRTVQIWSRGSVYGNTE